MMRFCVKQLDSVMLQMYDVLLKIEEFNYFNGVNAKSEEPIELASKCINRVLSNNKFLHIMEIRKGRVSFTHYTLFILFLLNTTDENVL